MHRNRDLIRYHLESVIELADESSLPVLRYLAEMAVQENEKPKETAARKQVQNEPHEALRKLERMLKVG